MTTTNIDRCDLFAFAHDVGGRKHDWRTRAARKDRKQFRSYANEIQERWPIDLSLISLPCGTLSAWLSPTVPNSANRS